MTSIPKDVRNYFKLELLIDRSNLKLRQLFKNRYSLFNNGKVWDDSPACGNNYLTNTIAHNKKLSLTSVEKISVSSGDSNKWDLTTLTALLVNIDRPTTLDTAQIQQLDNEDRLLKQLREIRNKLAHRQEKSIDDSEFNQLWIELSTILVAFGDIDGELDKLKDDTVFESSSQSINDENVKKAKELNLSASQAHKNLHFSYAITLFTKAIVLAGVPDHDRAIFYSNMSSTRLALYEQKSGSSNNCDIEDSTDQRYRALHDAKQARTLWPTWWKGHFRVGKVYTVLNEHEKAINSFERALALDPINNEIRKALDESRQFYGRQIRQEHLDPRLKPTTIFEHLNEMQQKMRFNPEHIRASHTLMQKIDAAETDVAKGHKYEHGDIDVEQDYEQAAKYFAKAVSQGNAEGMYNLARLTDRGLGVEKDHNFALKLLEQAAEQPPKHPIFNALPNLGVAEAEHSLGLRYAEGVAVQQNLVTAAYWYERAVGHGSAQSANNLALMYQHGAGVDKDLDKAEQLLQLPASRGDRNAMLTLAELLRGKSDLEMAKTWYDRACEPDNIVDQINRSLFEPALQVKQKLIDCCPPNLLQMITAIKNIFDSLQTTKTVYKQCDHPYIYDYNVLSEYANCGSITAKKICDSLEHFAQALNILTQSERITEKQENIFVHELSECYRIEHIVVQIPGVKMHQEIVEIVDRVLHHCNLESTNVASQLNEDVLICYALLHIDSHELIIEFLDSCKQKYPKSIYFFDLSASVNGWLHRYEASVFDANTGLEIDPNYYELLYSKAVALRLLGRDMNEAIEAYRAFLAVAPKDHRKVPESYYAMAACYFDIHKLDGLAGIVKKVYKQGEDAEKVQLPCFLPYKSNNKTLLKSMFDAQSLPNAEIGAPRRDHKLRLTNPHRIEVIKQHREWEAKSSFTQNNATEVLIAYSYPPRVQQQTAKSLIGLKAISLKEMHPIKDHVYDGYVLSVTIIEQAYSWTPPIHLVIEDENFDCERMFIYSFPDGQGEYITSKVFTIGSKMNIINPYLRLDGNDMTSLVRIDDFSSIIMQSESEQVLNMCRCCGEPNALHVCSKCKQARYCTKECETIDRQLYQHKLICQRR
ncbi:unnamed protein product [Rotaria socialis]|uniref:MYND-type domain-containing protein n=1 Tax=Rotaria socialis TaxID=392032 RepID=A0A818DF91_9BILA|nr:unnamed protein product [Rotaria socialis]CAF4518947.1 unnamed protein product [Rotaria socialis]